jgi:hypothetical protein
MYFDQFTVATTLRILCNAYLYSCVVLMGLSYLAYLLLNRTAKAPQQSHWFS